MNYNKINNNVRGKKAVFHLNVLIRILKNYLNMNC